MKAEDELDAEIGKIFDEVTATKVEIVNGKPRISDEATIAQMERERTLVEVQSLSTLPALCSG